jgi:hypothetical protein
MRTLRLAVLFLLGMTALLIATRATGAGASGETFLYELCTPTRARVEYVPKCTYEMEDGRSHLSLPLRLVESLDGYDEGRVGQLALSDAGKLAFTVRHFNPDTVSDLHTLYLWDGYGPKRLGEYIQEPGFRWSKDGQLAVFAYRGDSIYEAWLWKDEIFQRIGHHQGNFRGYTWGPDGQLAYVTYAKGGYHAYVWDGLTLARVSQMPHVDLDVNKISGINGQLAFSPGGQLAFSSSHGHGKNYLYVWNGLKAFEISHSLVTLVEPKWSKDGRLAFVSGHFTAGDLYVWDGQQLIKASQPLSGHQIGGFDWHEDGRLAFIARTSSMNGDVYVWDGSTLTNVSQSPDDEKEAYWLNDGRLAFSLPNPNVGSKLVFRVWDRSTITNVDQQLFCEDNPRQVFSDACKRFNLGKINW